MPTSFLFRAIVVSAAVVLFAGASAYAIHYRAQPLIDLFNFRQAQTALTSYWMIRDGWRLAYETPIGGAPWAIPFEFPIYQAIVAAIAAIFHISLDTVGRMLSFGFLTACVIPARQLQQRLRLPPESFWIFCCLFFSAPIYIYWGRTFMIETAALFFTCASLPYFVDLLRQPAKPQSAILFALWTSLSLLQKITTGLPVIAILGATWLISMARTFRSGRERTLPRAAWIGALAFALPLVLGYVWTEYSSQVRAQNTLGAYLTNSGLSSWNWGTLHQRVSSQLWKEVIWRRIFERNLGGILGLIVITSALVVGRLRPRRDLMVIAILLGLLPFFTFTNLYIVHDYYPTACVIFILAALALALGQFAVTGIPGQIFSLLLLFAFMGSGAYHFRATYFAEARYHDRAATHPELEIARTLQASTPEDGALVLYGYDWSSQLAYLSQRRTFTVPEWPGKLSEVWANPERFLGSTPLAAIAVCNNVERPNPLEIERRFLSHEGFYGGVVRSCTLLVKDDQAAYPALREGSPIPAEGTCHARVESIEGYPSAQGQGHRRIAMVRGSIVRNDWDEDRSVPILVALTQDRVIIRSGRAVVVPPSNDQNPIRAVSAMIDTTGIKGSYDILILSASDGHLQRCSLDTPGQTASLNSGN